MADDRRGKSLFFRNQDLPSWPFFFLARKTVGPFFPAKKAVLIPNGSAKKAVVGKKKKTTISSNDKRRADVKFAVRSDLQQKIMALVHIWTKLINLSKSKYMV
jgi:hypothetical protein